MAIKISVCLDIWATGGAEIGYWRIFKELERKCGYEWERSMDVNPTANLVIYSNNHRFYEQAKKLNIPAILRTTGPRSINMPQPEDLKSVICSSKKAFELSNHSKKYLIYNGIDLEALKLVETLKEECDLLYSPARVGVGQKVEVAIQYAQQHNRNLTVLGARQHLAEDTYEVLKKKYPQVRWTGLVQSSKALQYMKSCKDYIVPTPVHGVSNAVIEAVAFDKNIINLGGVEIPAKEDIDIKVTVKKYEGLINEALSI
jgi:hypothetical protein